MKRGRSREADRIAAADHRQAAANQLSIARISSSRLLAGEKSKPNQELQCVRKEFQIRAGVLQSAIADARPSRFRRCVKS